MVRGLSKTYRTKRGDIPALMDIDLSIPVGSIFGLLGPNGAGKSTFINVLAGMVIKTTGTVRIWGFDQDANPRMSRASIGVVPQELNIDPFFTPYETLDTQAGLYAVPRSRRRTREILETVGLTDRAHSYARSLSGGMMRRLLIGKAMVHTPPILVLDEPTAGVDVALRHQLWRTVRELNEAGTTVILTTHYIEEAEQMCDTVAILDRGGIVACEKKETLLLRIDYKTLIVTPESPVTSVPESITRIDTATASLREDGTLEVSYSRSQVAVARIFAALAEAGIQIRDLSIDEPHLEEVFLSLTARNHGAADLPEIAETAPLRA